MKSFESGLPRPDLVAPQLGALLLCGGKGNRLKTVTGDEIPKSLVEIGGKPLLQYSTELVDHPDVDTIYLLIGHHAPQIMSWAERNITNKPIVAVEQSKPGVRGALLAGLSAMKESAAIVMNTDELRVGCNMDAMIAAYRHRPEQALMLGTTEANLYRHRLLNINDENTLIASELKATRFFDDNETRGLVNAGVSIVGADAAHIIDESHGDDWSSLIDPLTHLGRLSVHTQDNVRYFNVGTPSEYDEADSYVSSVPSLRS